MQFLSKKQLLFAGGAILAVLVIGFLFIFSLRPSKTEKAVDLTVWGTVDPDSFFAFSRAYNALRPSVRINYEQLPESSYETRLLSALASGEGPDVFFVKSRSLPVDLLVEAPTTQFTLEEMRNLFPKVIEQDFAPEGKIYALPLYLDTLALIYNQNIFNRVGVVDPPKTWEAVEELASDIKVLGDDGRIKKAGIALGGSLKSINNAADILEVLMLQNGTDMLDEGLGRANFASGYKGVLAFDYYTRFGDPSNPSYNWDDAGKNSLDSFAAEESSMIINYKSQVDILKKKNPFLEIGVAPLPQADLGAPVSFAEYHGLGVSKQSKEKAWAWDFVIQATTKPEIAREYSKSSNLPPALKTLISENLKNSEFGVFVRQSLVARSWFYSKHKDIADALSQAIQKRISGAADSRTALNQAQNQVSNIIKSGQ